MSRLRNRNIRTKIDAVTKWGDFGASQNGGKMFENGGKTTADSGVMSDSFSSKFSQLGGGGMKTRRGNWEEKEDLEVLDSNGDHGRMGIREGNPRHRSDDEDADVSSECSSVDTLKVLDEIRNLEDTVKSMSAESYNSWNEEYENDNTLLVKEELERMERVLQCLEPIPGHYDKDEYRLWIKTFPLLGLVSRSSSGNISDRLTPKDCDIKPPQATVPSPPNATVPSNASTTTTYSNKRLAVNNTINPRTTHINSNDSFLQLAPLNIATRRHSFKPTTSGRNGSNRIQNSLPSASLSSANRTSDWLKDLPVDDSFRTNLYKPLDRFEKEHARRKSSKAEPFKSSSEFIVLPPIEGKELRSSSAATIASLASNGGGNKLAPAPLGRLKHPVYPLYENDRESDHNDGFVSFRHHKRKYK